MERLLESVPQLILQSYVILRYTGNLSLVSLASILVSFLTLASKIITDDANMVIDSANQKVPPSLHFICRFCFRIAEIR